MVASELMEKRRPTYDLDALKQAIGSVDRLAITTSALRDASGLGFDRGAIVETIHNVDRHMFVKSMTTFPDHRLWQDVYHVPMLGLLF
jgi:motility quorum-sensing regulator / GCU-specific mRNA interferase toxin